MVLGYDDGRVGVLHASNVAIPGRWMKGWQVVGEQMTGVFADWNDAELVRTAGEVASEKIAGAPPIPSSPSFPTSPRRSATAAAARTAARRPRYPADRAGGPPLRRRNREVIL